MSTLHIYEFAATWFCMYNRLKFSSSGCLIWTNYTFLTAFRQLILIIPVLDQLYFCYCVGQSVKRAVQIVAVALGNQFVLEKL